MQGMFDMGLSVWVKMHPTTASAVCLGFWLFVWAFVCLFGLVTVGVGLLAVGCWCWAFGCWLLALGF